MREWKEKFISSLVREFFVLPELSALDALSDELKPETGHCCLTANTANWYCQLPLSPLFH